MGRMLENEFYFGHIPVGSILAILPNRQVDFNSIIVSACLHIAIHAKITTG